MNAGVKIDHIVPRYWRGAAVQKLTSRRILVPRATKPLQGQRRKFGTAERGVSVGHRRDVRSGTESKGTAGSPCGGAEGEAALHFEASPGMNVRGEEGIRAGQRKPPESVPEDQSPMLILNRTISTWRVPN